jgi:flavin-dependent thymidylate synthase
MDPNRGEDEMKVTLLDYTGKGDYLPKDYAAKLLIYAKSTRLTQGEDLKEKIELMSNSDIQKNLLEIANTIRSSWEVIHYTWQVEGVTRAFTHQFVRSRHFSFAQQAMRVSDMSDFDTLCPQTVLDANMKEDWDSCMEVIKSTYQRFRKRGIPAQDARGVLPTNVLTNIVASGNLRAFSDMVGKRLNYRVQDEYQYVVRQMVNEVEKVHPWVMPFLNPERTQTPALDKILKTNLGGASPVDKPEVNDALKEMDRLKAVWG